MPEVRRARPGRGKHKNKPAARRSARKSAARASPASGRKAANWAAAQVRAARYRGANALRLAGFALAGVVIAAVGALALLGRLSDVGDSLYAGLEARLVASGYTASVVDVTGASRLDPDVIAFAVGVDPTRSLLSVDPERARANVESLSWVRSAAVVRLWPNRIAVVVEEREPYALWQRDGDFRVIGADGAVIGDADPAAYAELPRVVGAGAHEAAAEILSLMARQPEIAALTTHAVRVGERRWNLRLAAGGDILLPEDDPASALALLASLHAERGTLHLDAAAFDMRSDGRLVIRAWPDRAQRYREEGREA